MARRKAAPPLGSVRRVVRFEIEADEATLQWLAAIMLFSQRPLKPEEVKAEEPFPFDEPPSGDELKLDVTGRLSRYIAKHGVELAKRLLAELDATKISDLDEAGLQSLWIELVKSNTAEPRKPLT